MPTQLVFELAFVPYCTMLACRMPDYLAVCTTGHDLTDPVPSRALPTAACLTPTIALIEASPCSAKMFFFRAGNGGTGAARTPHRSRRRQGGAGSVSGTGGSRALAPRLSTRSSSSGVPPVVLGSHGLTGVLSDGKCWEWTGAGRRRGSRSGLPRG